MHLPTGLVNGKSETEKRTKAEAGALPGCQRCYVSSKLQFQLSSVVTSKPANGGQLKTGQRKWPGLRLF